MFERHTIRVRDDLDLLFYQFHFFFCEVNLKTNKSRFPCSTKKYNSLDVRCFHENMSFNVHSYLHYVNVAYPWAYCVFSTQEWGRIKITPLHFTKLWGRICRSNSYSSQLHTAVVCVIQVEVMHLFIYLLHCPGLFISVFFCYSFGLNHNFVLPEWTLLAHPIRWLDSIPCLLFIGTSWFTNTVNQTEPQYVQNIFLWNSELQLKCDLQFWYVGKLWLGSCMFLQFGQLTMSRKHLAPEKCAPQQRMHWPNGKKAYNRSI